MTRTDVLNNWYSTFTNLREHEIPLSEWLTYWKGRRP